MADLALDHLVFVAEKSALEKFRDAGFSVISGGKHDDGITANYLIGLDDGIYLELLYFVQEDKDHFWWPRSSGWAGYCLLPQPNGSEAFVSHVEKVPNAPDYDKYTPPRPFQRKTDEGTVLNMKVTFPKETARNRGRMPFLCEDITSRADRLPTHAKSHTNGVTRVHSIVLLAQPSQLAHYLRSLETIFGTPSDLPSSADKGASSYPPRERYFSIASPAGQEQVQVIVREPENDEETQWIQERGEGLYSVVLATQLDAKDLHNGIVLKHV